MFLCVLPLPFQFLAQKSVRCAGMLLGQIWSSGRVGEGVKTEDLEALKQNTIVIVLIFISIAILMQCFSLTPGIPLLWSPPGFSLETSTGTGTGRVPLWFWIVGKWMRVEEIGSNLVVQLCGLPLKCGTDRSGGLAPRNRKGLVEMVMAAIILWGASHRGSVRMRGQCYFYRWPLRHSCLWMYYSRNLGLGHLKVWANCIVKNRHFALLFLNSNH